jgi:acyl-CoA reductase-like NAD-dependent aldehyde dehydrogenase
MTLRTNTSQLDLVVSYLAAKAASWSITTLSERIGLLERLMPRIVENAQALADCAAPVKGYEVGSPWSVEDWVGGPWALAQNCAAYLRVLRRLAAGKDPVPESSLHQRGARTVVDVFPCTTWDALLHNGLRAEVWTWPGTMPAGVRDRAAGEYRGPRTKPGVALVLGAGNVAAITALDILHKLYAESQVVVAKMNPTNAYLRPHLEAVFAEFVHHGWLRFVDGDAAEGSYLIAHDAVDTVHITGSARSHDAIVWGTDALAERRRADDAPLLTKPFSSELGGVSPCIVAPGPWTAADFRFQAEHIVTSKVNNSGHNCIATQLLVVPTDWEGTERLLTAIRDVLDGLPPRTDYYPGAGQRIKAVLQAHPETELHGLGYSQALVPDIVDPDDVLITDEVFASALGVVRLPGRDTADFLANATAFANDRLPGTLGATLIVHPKTAVAERTAVETTVEGLRYGTVGVNCWSAIGFLLGYTPWGAYPGNTRQEIGSGIGFVHNAFMLEDVEKTVLHAPFAPMPRGLLNGSPSISPRPPYFVTSRTGRTTIELVTRFTAAPTIAKLPAIFASALRG